MQWWWNSTTPYIQNQPASWVHISRVFLWLEWCKRHCVPQNHGAWPSSCHLLMVFWDSVVGDAECVAAYQCWAIEGLLLLVVAAAVKPVAVAAAAAAACCCYCACYCGACCCHCCPCCCLCCPCYCLCCPCCCLCCWGCLWWPCCCCLCWCSSQSAIFAWTSASQLCSRVYIVSSAGKC